MRFKVFTPLLAAFFLFSVYSLIGAGQLLFMSLALALIPLLGLAFTSLSLTSVRVARQLPPHLYEGQSGEVTLRLQNRSVLPKFFLEVADSFPSTLGAESPVFAPGLRPRQHALASYSIRPEKRGVYPIGPVTLRASDPVGIVTMRRRIPLQDEILVYPTFPRLAKSPPLGADKLGSGVASRPSPGSAGLDFYNIRDYSPGDEFRRIHWKTTARTGSLKVVEREHPSPSHTTAILYFPPGSNPGSGKHSPLEYAVKLVAGLAWAAVETGGTFTLSIPPQKGLPSLFSVANRSRFVQLLDLLARVQEPSSTIVPPSPYTFGRKTGGGQNAFVVLAGKLDARISSAIASYRASGASVRLVTFEAASFRTPAPGLKAAIFTPPPVRSSNRASVIIRKGQDLAQALEEITLAH